MKRIDTRHENGENAAHISYTISNEILCSQIKAASRSTLTSKVAMVSADQRDRLQEHTAASPARGSAHCRAT